MSKSKVYTDHSAHQVSLCQEELTHTLRLIYCCQEFEIEIRRQKRAENLAPINCPDIEISHARQTREQINQMKQFPRETPWFDCSSRSQSNPHGLLIVLANVPRGRICLSRKTSQQKINSLRIQHYFFLDDPFLFKICADSGDKTCVFYLDKEALRDHSQSLCHSVLLGDTMVPITTIPPKKNLDSDSIGPTIYKDAHDLSPL
ncbi:hypothetical protein Tco_0620816 [Tanacetum coccineum]